MALERPSYKTIFERYAATVATRMEGGDAWLPASDLNTTGHVISEVASGLYDFGTAIARQILPNTQDRDELIIYAADWGVYVKPATPAKRTVTLSRTGIGDILIEAGTALTYAGQDYTTGEDATLLAADSQIALIVTAAVAGTAGNIAVGAAMALASPIAGVGAKGTVTAATYDGTDEEETSSLLARLLARMRRAPHGGNADDYERWAKECAGVTRAWVYRATPRPGFVTVLIARDGNAGTPIPTAEEVAVVQNYIDRPDIGPIGAECIVRGPDPVAVDLVIALDPNTAEAQAAVTAAIRAWYRAESEPGFLGARSRLSAAISAAAGEERHRILAPAADPALDRFDMAVVNTILFEDY